MKLPQSGEILEGKYRLEGVLGQGAFGLVFRATTLSTNRPVAVKVLKPAPDSRSGSRSARFLRELRTIANLQCPNTLTLYDYGRTEDGVLFMVTEYIEGEDLYDLVARRGRLDEHEVISILHQTLLSLAEAHELNVLHRDIKPHNIRLHQYQGEGLQVKVLDFGLSKSLEDEADGGLTGAGLVVGTPRYMSPEQLRGKALTPASDIYSLGLVAYEMLMGQPAVPLDAMVGNPRQIQLTAEDGVSRALREVVNKMLRRALPERHKSAGEVLSDLRALRMRGPVTGEEESDTIDEGTAAELLGDQFRRPTRVALEPSTGSTLQNRVLIGAVGVAVLGALVFFSWRIFDRDRREETRVPIPTRRAVALVNNPLQVPAPVVAAPVDAGPPAVSSDAATSDAPRGPKACSGLKMYQPGLQTLTEFSGLTEESVLVNIPRSYNPQVAQPVIWIFPDRLTDAAVAMDQIDFEAAGELDRFVVVAPDSGMMGRIQTAVARRSVERALRLLAAELCLDPDRMFVLGQGRGGEAAEAMLCAPLRIAGIATASYRIYPQQNHRCVPDNPVPFINISADRDPYEPIDGSPGCWILAPFSYEHHIELLKQPYVCGGSASRAKGLPKECQTWDCETPFVSCLVSGGRTWPRGRISGGCPNPTTKFPYTRTIWQFFDSIKPDTAE